MKTTRLLALIVTWQCLLSTAHNLRGGPSSSSVKLSNSFPSLNNTLELASLSLLVYAFRYETDDENVCRQINNGNITADVTVADDLVCRWYQHDRIQGTQVLLVESKQLDYLAVVFAGTDDLRTSLTDMDLFMAPYGDDNTSLPDPRPRIHQGFNNAVFRHQLFPNITSRIDRYYHGQRVLTTGHSLGAADAVLTAVGLLLHFQHRQRSGHLSRLPLVTCINFGCPRMGNSYWRDFVHDNPTMHNLALWRVVLGWDLVPRLPEFMLHTGHTLQLNTTLDNNNNTHDFEVRAYYQHYGDASLGYAGVPFGWSAKPFIWVPGALWSHSIERYWAVLQEWSLDARQRTKWVRQFVPMDEAPTNTDDEYVDPPDDDDDDDDSAAERVVSVTDANQASRIAVR